MFVYSNQTYFVKDTNLNLLICEIYLCLAHCPLAQSTAGLPNTNYTEYFTWMVKSYPLV